PAAICSTAARPAARRSRRTPPRCSGRSKQPALRHGARAMAGCPGSSVPATAADAVAVFQVAKGFHLDEAARVQQRAYGATLIPAMLDQQPAAGLEIIGRIADDAANRIQSIVARRQCAGRLETQIALGQ